MFSPLSKRHFTPDEIEAFGALNEHSTSKKDSVQRRVELMQAYTGPLEKFFEENMLFYLTDSALLFPTVLSSRIEIGSVSDSDCMNELFRQI